MIVGGIMRICIHVIAWLLIIGLSFDSLAQTDIRKCTVKTAIGSVKIRRGSTVNWVDAKTGMVLRERDAIRTFMESEAVLETDDGSTFKAGENTTVEMSVFFSKGEQQNTKIRILNGSLMSNVKKMLSSRSTFEFETPTVTAAIRGTIVGLEVSKEKTEVRVYEGSVAVSGSNSKIPVMLKENQMVSVARGQKKIVVQKIDSVDNSPGAKRLRDTLPEDTSDIDKDTVSTGAAGATVNTALILASPTDGQLVMRPVVAVNGKVGPGTDVLINGIRQLTGTDGAFSSQVGIPDTPGDHVVEIEIIQNGKSQKVIRTVRYKPQLVLTVKSPVDKQVFTKTIIPVSGKVTPGAEVLVNSMKVLVLSDGSFNGSAAIPNEEADVVIEIDATLDENQIRESRTIVYKPEYRFAVLSPSDKDVVTTTQIQVRGEVQPVSSEITVNGKPVSVAPNGTFTGMVQIPDEEGPVTLEFDVTSSGVSRSESRTIVYKRLPDMIVPVVQGLFPDKPLSGSVTFTVVDRTVDEKITFTYEIDGSVTSETGLPNSPFTVPIENGTHTYVVYAKDNAGNVSAKLTKTITYLSTSNWVITMRKPAGVEYIDIPPSAPDLTHSPRYTVELSIDNLPDDDMNLIRAVSITNQTTGATLLTQTFTSNTVERDFELSPRTANVFLIEATDINGVKKTQTVQVILR